MVEQRRMNCGDQLNVKYINNFFLLEKPLVFPFFLEDAKARRGLPYAMLDQRGL